VVFGIMVDQTKDEEQFKDGQTTKKNGVIISYTLSAR